jgi:acyl-CoA synthetase (AMP-forming)/AMP-acid ligase II
MGYYGAPLMTAEVVKDGWLNTGDFARIDKEGRIAICGRSKDLIIHKGFNIYPQEIENVLMQHPAVFKAAIVGKHEDESGEIPIAYVAVREKGFDGENVLRNFCRQNLAAYKIPRKFIFLEDLPMNATGKVDKKKLHNFLQ